MRRVMFLLNDRGDFLLGPEAYICKIETCRGQSLWKMCEMGVSFDFDRSIFFCTVIVVATKITG